ncbi:MAG: radical SAM protein [Nitrospinae bacterium]|nr:radical SAM protein [Nitrospinota bacterium]
MLIDKFNRALELLQITASDACQYECAHCSAIRSTPDSGLMPTPHIIRFVTVMARLGLGKVRIIGREPLLRPDIIELIRGMAEQNPKLNISLSTNGKLAGAMAPALAASGLSRLFITLPALDRELFTRITGIDGLAEVLAGIEAAMATGGFTTIIRMPVITGLNSHVTGPMADWAVAKGLNLYLIEPRLPERGKIVPEEIIKSLSARYTLTRMTGVSLVNNPWRVEGTGTFIKIVTADGRRECHGCNRLWLSAEGILRLCYSSPEGHDLRALFEENPTDAELVEFAAKAPLNKPLGIYHPLARGEMTASR